LSNKYEENLCEEGYTCAYVNKWLQNRV